jgi:very-short-patch-repair endonuclease
LFIITEFMVYLGRTVTRDMYFGAKPDLFRMSERMRKNPTEAEKILWKHLKKFRSSGYIFRRQHPIDFYIADFYRHKLKLVIEVDGEIHETEEMRDHDDGRTGHLEHFGIKVIRFSNEEVLINEEHVIRQIRAYLDEIASPALLGAGDKRG